MTVKRRATTTGLAVMAGLAVSLVIVFGTTTVVATAPAVTLTLRIGTDDEPGRPAADQIEEFARSVADRSSGAIVVEPVWHAAGDTPDWDQQVSRLVTSGELEMGLIPSRAWDTEGVTTLRALNAPFLVTRDELVTEIITWRPRRRTDERTRRGRCGRFGVVPRGVPPSVRVRRSTARSRRLRRRRDASAHVGDDGGDVRGARRYHQRRRTRIPKSIPAWSRRFCSTRQARRRATSPTTRRSTRWSSTSRCGPG